MSVSTMQVSRYPTFNLDAFLALQNFSGQHFAGVTGHMRGLHIEIGNVQSISLMNIRPT